MVCENALGSRKSPLIGTCLKSSIKVGVCVYISRAVSVKLASAKLFLSPSQWDLNLPLLFLLMSQHSFEMNENGFLIPCWCEHTFWLSTNLRRGPPIQPINSIDVTVGNQLDYWAGVILCFISVCQALDFFCLSLLFLCLPSPVFKFAYQLLCPSLIFLHILPISSCYHSFAPVVFDLSKCITYLLFGIYKGHNNKYMPLWHMPHFIPTYFCRFDCNCQIFPLMLLQISDQF